MASKVDESTHSPITRTYNFSTVDSKAYSWLSLASVASGKVEWYWYSLDGRWYKVGPINIPANPSGGYWPSYNVWCSIDTGTLYGDTWDLELPSDEFYVDITRNDRQILTEYFKVDQ